MVRKKIPQESPFLCLHCLFLSALSHSISLETEFLPDWWGQNSFLLLSIQASADGMGPNPTHVEKYKMIELLSLRQLYINRRMSIYCYLASVLATGLLMLVSILVVYFEMIHCLLVF